MNALNVDPAFYDEYTLRVLRNEGRILSELYGLSLHLTEVYYPWHRAFEIGMSGDL